MRWLCCERKAARLAIDLRIPLRPLMPRSSSSPHCSATIRTRLSDLWVLSWSTTKIQPAWASVAMVFWMWFAKSVSVRVGETVGAIIFPLATLKLAIKQTVPWRMYSNSIRSTSPRRGRSVGNLLSLAWIPQSSSQLTRWIFSDSRVEACSYRSQMVWACW